MLVDRGDDVEGGAGGVRGEAEEGAFLVESEGNGLDGGACSPCGRPAEGDGAGQGVVLEVDEVVRETGMGAAERQVVAVVEVSGIGLASDEPGEGVGLAEGGEVRVGQGSLHGDFDGDEGDAGGIGGRENVAIAGGVALEVVVGFVSPRGEARWRRMDEAAHDEEVGVAEDAGMPVLEQGEVGAGADGDDGGAGFDAVLKQVEGGV